MATPTEPFVSLDKQRHAYEGQVEIGDMQSAGAHLHWGVRLLGFQGAKSARISLYYNTKYLVFHRTMLKFRQSVFRYKSKHSRGPFQGVTTWFSGQAALTVVLGG